ncbi:uncharacterized protein [Argopecten irradians]|uniref:uncharacterized protein n=1 Tax=Argopecten irradians TaxID=31199 RepID=UPI00371EDB3E
MGTESHYTIEIERETTQTNISTSSYPGMLFLIRLYKKDHLSLATRFVRSACGTTMTMNTGETVFISSPSYPENSKSMTLCKWTFKKPAGTWFKMTMNELVLPNDSCQTYINISGHSVMCNTSSKIEDVFYVTTNVTTLKFVGKSAGAVFKFTVKVIPSMSFPVNFTTDAIDDMINVSWTPLKQSVPDLQYVVTYNIIPSLTETEHLVASNASMYSINVTSHRGQLFNVSLALRMPHWESNRTEAVITRADCKESYFLEDGKSIILSSPDFPEDVSPYVLCSWSVTANPRFFLRISFLDPVGSYNLTIPWKIVSVVDDKETLIHILDDVKSLIINSSSVELQLRTDKLRYTGFRMVVNSVAPPTLPPRNVHVNLIGTILQINWQAPLHRAYDVTEYVIQYDVVPDIEDEEVRVNGTTNQHSINVRDYQGRLFRISVMSVTGGGRSAASKPVYIRTHCGGKRTLQHGDTMLVISPRNQHNIYPPDVVCKWSVSTELHWLKIVFQHFYLEISPGCESDSLEIDGFRFCGSKIENTLVYKKASIEIMFTTNGDLQDTGFIFSLKAVAPAPEIPENLRVISSLYGLTVKWSEPNRNSAYVTGYRINFRYQNYSTLQGIVLVNSSESLSTKEGGWFSITANSDTFVYVINTRDRPGVMFEVWMESMGEAVDSPSTEVITARAHCGGIIEFDNTTKYISSPRYPYMDNGDIYCSYHVLTTAEIKLTFIALNFNEFDFSTSCSHGYLFVDGVDRSCEPNTSDISPSFYGHDFNIEYHGSPRRSRFLIELTLSERTEKVSDYSFTLNHSLYTRPQVMPLILCIYFVMFCTYMDQIPISFHI